ncbi:unnamed protein product [Spirodela intermedia]|uniref:Rab escort protein 1 n=1 Tax=Spirodela intermedia TaxID=51605 RepID=A0A7I8KLZ8_SPIIN|nr:unnamed protein product [Spirodela intermedia]
MAEATAGEHPVIDPSSFDLVVSGTGLVESLVAAAASASGKSVLHLDSNPYYGVHYSSLSPQSLSSFLQQNAPAAADDDDGPRQPAPKSSVGVAVDLQPRRLYSHVEIAGEVPEPSRGFLLDLSGPRVLYCADPMVDVMLRSGASHHIEFKSVDGSMIYWDGKLQMVPDSREAIFKDKSLSLTEKTQMTRFLKLVREHITSEGGEGEEASKISGPYLEMPFVKFLEKQRLPPKIKLIVLYAIAMADYDQDNPESCNKLMDTKEGLESLSLYSSSIGRFPNAVGALIYPIYGQGELPQAFCRLAAVKGALYVLRMPASSLLFDKEDKAYKGVRLATGQDINCHRILMDSSSVVPPPFPSPDPLESTIEASHASKVARLVCITRSSLHPQLSNILIILPPRSLFPAQETSIRALQLGSGLAVCPPDFFVVYCSTKCDDAIRGKEHLLAAMNALFELPGGKNEQDEHSGDLYINENTSKSKPVLLWSASYVQELTEGCSLSSSPMPDGNLDYGSLLKSTEKLFHSLYPQEEFFTASRPSEEEGDGITEG